MECNSPEDSAEKQFTFHKHVESPYAFNNNANASSNGQFSLQILIWQSYVASDMQKSATSRIPCWEGTGIPPKPVEKG